MDEGGGAELGAALEGAEQDVVVHHQRALVGHEVLEGVDAVGVDDLAHLARDLVRPPGDREMVGIVARRLLGFAPPVVIGLDEGLAGSRNAEIHDHGGAAGERRLGAPLEIVRRHGAHEHELHVRVRIDPARHDVGAARVDDLGAGRCLEVLADGDDPLALHEHVGASAEVGIHNGAAADEKGHDGSPLIVLDC